MDPYDPTPGVITVWSDISCPWATMALATLRRAAAEAGAEVRIDHRAFPLELLNRAVTPKPDHDDEVARISAVRPDLGWSPWSAPDWQYPVTTLPALEAVQAARSQGLVAADELDAALRHAYFVEHRCVSLLPVVEDVAATCRSLDAELLGRALREGVGRRAVYADLEVAGQGQVQGSPHFWTARGSFAPNPGVADAAHFEAYDPGWTTELLAIA